MVVHIELEQDKSASEELGRASSAGPNNAPLEEASFRVVESGKVRFFVQPRVEIEAPTSIEDVQRFSFTLAPRNCRSARRVCVGRRRMPDPRIRERQWSYVDRVGCNRGLRYQPGAIEVARGTYAIATHRDHAHLLYELDMTNDAVSVALLRQLRIVSRASYIAVVVNRESKWLGNREPSHMPWIDGAQMDEVAKHRFTPLDPVFLDHEGTELMLMGGGTVRKKKTPSRHGHDPVEHDS